MPKYGVFSCPYFPASGLNTENELSLRIQSECGKIRTRKYSVFGHFSHSEKEGFSFKIGKIFCSSKSLLFSRGTTRFRRNWLLKEKKTCITLMVSITSSAFLRYRPCYQNKLNYDNDNKCQKLTTK